MMATACSSMDFVLPDVHFQPWQGAEYGRSGLGSKRLLLLGEAHYDDHIEYDVPHLTRDVIARQCDGRQPLPFFTKASGLVRPASGDTGGAIWPSVAFYNYIPMLAGTAPGQRPTDEMWRAAGAPFRAVIDAIAPICVLVLGVDVWNHLEIPSSEVAGLDPDRAIRRRAGDLRDLDPPPLERRLLTNALAGSRTASSGRSRCRPRSVMNSLTVATAVERATARGATWALVQRMRPRISDLLVGVASSDPAAFVSVLPAGEHPRRTIVLNDRYAPAPHEWDHPIALRWFESETMLELRPGEGVEVLPLLPAELAGVAQLGWVDPDERRFPALVDAERLEMALRLLGV